MNVSAILAALLFFGISLTAASGAARSVPADAYPRILIHNFLTDAATNDQTVAELAKRDVIVMAPWFRNHLDTIQKIRALNPNIVILMYATSDCAFYGDTQTRPNGDVIGIGNVDEAGLFTSHLESLLYISPTGQLTTTLASSGTEAFITGLDTAFLQSTYNLATTSVNGVSRAVFAIDNELVRVESATTASNSYILRRGQCGTTPAVHQAGATVRLVSQPGWSSTLQTQGAANAELLQINLSDRAPLIGGRRPWQIKADFYITTYWNNPAWRAAFDGFFFDNGDLWQTSATQPVDLNWDGVADTAAYGSLENGVRSFYDYVRQQCGPEALMTPNNLDDFLPAANGRHREFFLQTVSTPLFTSSSSSQWQFSVWEYSMEPYRAYQAAGSSPTLPLNSAQPGSWTNYQQMRFSLGSCLLLDGASQFRASSSDFGNWEHWFDEYAVDAPGVATTNRSGLHWLGRPLGAAVQVVQPLATPNLLAGANWTLRMNTCAVASLSNQSGVLTTQVTQLPDHQAENVQIYTSLTGGLNPGDTVTLSLDMRASSPRLIQFALAGGANQTSSFRLKIDTPLYVSTSWESRVFSFTCRDDRPISTYPLSFYMGSELGTVELRNVSWQKGHAVQGWTRQFDRGLVVVNPTLAQQTFSIAGNYRRISGTQDPAHNNGQAVGQTLTVQPCDAYLLASIPAQVSMSRTGAHLRLNVTNSSGTYSVMATTNLADPNSWTRVFTNTAPFTYTDTNALQLYPWRFYRVVTP
jgi:hypothetical protein